jgi:hypothetical protein
MRETPDVFPAATLRDAYKVKGFRVRARIDSYDDLEHPAFVLTQDRRTKKRCAAVAGSFAGAGTTNAGGGLATLAAATGRSISIFKCNG